MSRVSRKSELSPSVTRGSNDIDLGKNSGVNMGQKSQPSITSRGIGVTQEVTNIGGTSLNVGVNVDVTPIDFGVTIDSAQNSISVAGGAEVPGGLLGVSGGIEVDLNTGEVIGGSIGGEIGGLGINLSNSKKGGLGIEFTVQIPGTPIELSLGLGFPPKEEPTPTPTPTTPFSSGWGKGVLSPIDYPPGDNTTVCHYALSRHYSSYEESYGNSQLIETSIVPNVAVNNNVRVPTVFVGISEYKSTTTREHPAF